jgi:microcystin-dependent protein
VKTKLLASAAGALLATAVIYCVVPPPQRVSAQFADQSTYGGTSTGSANAQAITIGNYSSNLTGVPLRFIPGFTNTGPATISISGLTPVAILRPSSIGLVAFSGQELFAGEPTSVEYNGTNYVLTSNVDMTRIGQTVEFRGSTAPRGTLIEDGSCVSTTTYAALNNVIGTLYGTCSAGFFKLPFSNGTAFVAFDAQGANGAANRMTTASCATPNSPSLCGSETETLTLAQSPAGITSFGSANVASTSTGTFATGNLATTQPGTTGSSVVTFIANGAEQVIPVSSNGTASIGSTSNNTGGQAHPILNPVLPGIRAIKF